MKQPEGRLRREPPFFIAHEAARGTGKQKDRARRGRQSQAVKWRKEENGGARRNRTADLLNAIQALSQLSYGPTHMSVRRAGVPPPRRPGL